jgi:hypothetical protein
MIANLAQHVQPITAHRSIATGGASERPQVQRAQGALRSGSYANEHMICRVSLVGLKFAIAAAHDSSATQEQTLYCTHNVRSFSVISRTNHMGGAARACARVSVLWVCLVIAEGAHLEKETEQSKNE